MIQRFRNTFIRSVKYGTMLVLLGSCNEAEIKDDGKFSAAVAPKILGVCTQCHANGRAESGFGYVDDVARMIEKGKIARGNPEGSRIFQKISSNWGGGRRMPLRGPYFSEGDQNELKTWIQEDLYVRVEGKEWAVEVVLGSGVTVDKVGKQLVPDGDTLKIAIKAEPVGSKIEIEGTGDCVGGTLAGDSYETKKIKGDCSLTVTRKKPSTGESEDPEEFTVSMAGIYGKEAGAEPNIATSTATKIITKGEVATFEFTLRAGDTISSDVSLSILGSCPKGEITLIDAASRRYAYSTGTIVSTCAVEVKSDNPCPTVTLTEPSFTEVSTLLTNGVATKSCTSCHYPGSGEVADASADFGNQDGPLDHAKITTIRASNGKYLIEAGKPLDSSIYMQIDPFLNYRSRMPYEDVYVNVENRSKVCNWIFNGAKNN